MTRRNPRPCSCGATYEAMRTGMTFATVRKMMWRGADEKWRQKRRHCVLGFWRELKLKQWDATHGGCP